MCNERKTSKVRQWHFLWHVSRNFLNAYDYDMNIIWLIDVFFYIPGSFPFSIQFEKILSKISLLGFITSNRVCDMGFENLSTFDFRTALFCSNEVMELSLNSITKRRWCYILDTKVIQSKIMLLAIHNTATAAITFSAYTTA